MSSHSIVDRSHMGRNFTGIERITEELFKKGALGDIDIDYIECGPSRVSKIFTQMASIPALSLKHRDSVMIFPGFPPSPLIFKTNRCIMYTHDLFLIERWNELNLTAKIYMNPIFRLSLSRISNFFVNSETTKRNLERYCRKDANVTLYRPAVRNVFDLKPIEREFWQISRKNIKIIAIGTVEPRKNYVYAANICKELANLLKTKVTLHIVGRPGWSGDYDTLKNLDNVVLHGHIADSELKNLVDESDLYLCTSNDEGLGLPLLEVQYGGIPVAAPDKPIFREILDQSALLFENSDAKAAAKKISAAISSQDRLRTLSTASTNNVARWNIVAEKDKSNAIRIIDSIYENAKI